MDIRNQVLTALTDLLRWDERKALPFLDSLTEAECEDIVAHVRESETPIVGVAAVVYRVRMRQAGGDEAAKRRAAVEAGEHYRLIPTRRAVGTNAGSLPDRQAKAPARVARHNFGSRRREFDNH